MKATTWQIRVKTIQTTVTALQKSYRMMKNQDPQDSRTNTA